MRTIERRQYEMLDRLDNFGDAHIDEFADTSFARVQFAAVATAVTQLRSYAISKMSAEGEGMSTKLMAREALLDRLKAMELTARAIALDTPGLEDKFHLPVRLPDQAMLTAARLFARDAEPLTAQFIGHSTPTFLAELKGLIEQFERAIHEQNAGKDEHVMARVSIKTALSSGIAAARKLDAIVSNQLHGDEATMAVWKRDRRIEYPGKAKRAAAGPPAAATPPKVEEGGAS